MAREATQQAPDRETRGRRLDTNLSPGILRRGAGPQARKTERPVYCGAIAGRAFGMVKHPNSKNPHVTSTRFVGQFLGVKADGTILNTAEAYLPGSLTRTIEAVLDLQKGHIANPVPFSVEIWAEPDPRETSTIGYRYVCYDVTPQTAEAPLLALAYESGLIEAPQNRLPPQEAAIEEDDDPDAGIGE